MTMRIGLESSHSFGDCLFNLPLIKAIANQYNCKPSIAVQPQFADAFINVPFIEEVIHIGNMHDGIRHFNEHRYDIIHQLTQNHNFFEFKNQDPNHSLIDTPFYVGRKIGLVKDIDKRPLFFPTANELMVAKDYIKSINSPIVAIEGIAKSGQSWADKKAMEMIISHHKKSHTILWLSNEGMPNHDVVHLNQFTRREIICMLRLADIFYSVGSGFFCSSMAEISPKPPARMVVLWIDELYKYESRINESKWHDNLQWVHNHNELELVLR